MAKMNGCNGRSSVIADSLIKVGYRVRTGGGWRSFPSDPPSGGPSDRGCPAALFERSEFSGRPGWWSGAKEAAGWGSGGRFFGYLLAAQQESYPPAGARLGYRGPGVHLSNANYPNGSESLLFYKWAVNLQHIFDDLSILHIFGDECRAASRQGSRQYQAVVIGVLILFRQC